METTNAITDRASHAEDFDIDAILNLKVAQAHVEQSDDEDEVIYRLEDGGDVVVGSRNWISSDHRVVVMVLEGEGEHATFRSGRYWDTGRTALPVPGAAAVQSFTTLRPIVHSTEVNP
jgi:hypothetical protein